MQDRERILSSASLIGYKPFDFSLSFAVYLPWCYFEVLHINNKKETSQFLKSLSNAYVFLCRIVGTPPISIY